MGRELRIWTGLCVVILCFSGAAHAQTPGYHLPGAASGAGSSGGLAVSRDGQFAAGSSYFSSSGITPGFVWSHGQGRNDFGLSSAIGNYFKPSAISTDGRTVAGSLSSGAFLWTEASGFQNLGSLSGDWRISAARAISDDGSVVVGGTQDSMVTTGQAFRWTEATGMVGLGYPQVRDVNSVATGLSRDGSVVVGYGTDFAGGHTDAFVWTQGAGMQTLPTLGTGWDARARGMNSDATFVAGDSTSSTGRRGVLWHNGVIQDLGIPSGWQGSYALDVSDDGSVILGGLVNQASYSIPAVWTSAQGWSPLSFYLASQGLPMPEGMNPMNDYTMSADGRTFVGTVDIRGDLPHALVVTIPAPGVVGCAVAGFVLSGMRRRRRMPTA